MKTLALLPTEKQQVQNLAQEIEKSGFAELDQDRIREDFHGLHGDIVQYLTSNCKKKIDDFNVFTQLMDEAANMITPEIAYAYGKTAKQAKADPETAFANFLLETNKAISKSEASIKCEELLDDLAVALGDVYSLIDEYFQLHTTINMVIKPLERFFNLGYWGDEYASSFNRLQGVTG